MSFKQK